MYANIVYTDARNTHTYSQTLCSLTDRRTSLESIKSSNKPQDTPTCTFVYVLNVVRLRVQRLDTSTLFYLG